MYFQVVIETNEKIGKQSKNKQYFELDKTDLSDIETRVLMPFFRGEDFQFDGYFLSKAEVKRIAIKQTEKTVAELSKYENDHMPSNVIMFVSPRDIVGYDRHTKDITNEVFDRVKANLSKATPAMLSEVKAKKVEILDQSKVFIVHGRDDLAKISAARFVEQLGLKAVILHEQVSGGKTIIEKIEEHTNVGFALVLYTPCDSGSLVGDTPKPRARQNVVFEHGYLISKLGRRNVCALVKAGTEIPNDINGVVYVPLDDHGAWHIAVAKELRNAGYSVDMNKVI
ncbi:TIR domain-containing protein [Rhodoferax saidenbachensis]|uniref:DNA-binding protein n=1 Tax=Rhodoferax saidenbachensis TaxID=1484693 RepID=A0A1P8KDA1_9BURK|nr:nucleotide-binding protein [Rhodoferax saidenbachensis]APW43989.1 DNA-binding protein [Rhodoferax saidenbachensis]